MVFDRYSLRRALSLNYYIKYFTQRFKHKDTHWSVIAKQITPKRKALQTFDNLYKEFYGSHWPSIRLALLSPSKYCAVVNSFGNTEETLRKLKDLGAIEMRHLFEVGQDFNEVNRDQCRRSGYQRSAPKTIDNEFKTREDPRNSPDEGLNRTVEDNQHKHRTLPESQASLRSKMDFSSIEYDRLVKPHESGNSVYATALQEFVPAAELKGMEDRVLESEQFVHYKSDGEFPITIKTDYELRYPENWKIVSFLRGNVSRFPPPRRGSLGVYDYYLLDAASILPVMALNLSLGDRVLDMCAAPGGKSLLALQTLYPDLLVCNDLQLSRTKRIHRVLEDYVFSMDSWRKKVIVTKRDGQDIDDVNTFNKILVDVPCTTDRHSVLEGENNIFTPHRVKERLKLPQLQSSLLSNALKIIAPGGTVVYSTCSLSPIQNDGVVQMALKKIWEETNFEFEVRDMSLALQSYKNIFKFGSSSQFQFGHIVVPFVPSNFGPTYFCKLVRKK